MQHKAPVRRVEPERDERVRRGRRVGARSGSGRTTTGTIGSSNGRRAAGLRRKQRSIQSFKLTHGHAYQATWSASIPGSRLAGPALDQPPRTLFFVVHPRLLRGGGRNNRLGATLTRRKRQAVRGIVSRTLRFPLLPSANDPASLVISGTISLFQSIFYVAPGIQ